MDSNQTLQESHATSECDIAHFLQTKYSSTAVSLNTLAATYKTIKVLATTGHEGPQGEKRHSSTLTLTSALDGGRMVNATPRQLYPRERDPGPVRTDAEYLTPTGTPDLPACSEALYRL